MSRVASGGGAGARGAGERWRRYRGVRRRPWGKWVSEIRVPGTRERLWLGSYAAPDAAAVAHDAAACLLRGLTGAGARQLNFPERAACYAHHRGHGQPPLSPRSVQRVASDAGMAADAQLVEARDRASASQPGGIAVARDVGQGEIEQWPSAPHSDGTSAPHWHAGGSRSSSVGSKQLVYGDISVDDMEILM